MKITARQATTTQKKGSFVNEEIMASFFTVAFPSVSVSPVVYVFAFSSIHAKDCFLIGVFPGFPKHIHRSEKSMFFREYNVYGF